MSCKLKEEGREAMLRFSNLDGLDFLNHGYTTRKGGFSREPYEGLNMGLFTKDEQSRVAQNHARAAQIFGYDLGEAIFSNQIHEDGIAVVDASFKGTAFWLGRRALGTDAMITNLPKRPLVAFFADCAGIFIADPVNRAVGIAHAGWKGTAKEIGRKTLQAMERTYGTRASDCLAAVGPSIGPCCFEVKWDVAEVFADLYGEAVVRKKEGKDRWMVDLWEANRLQLAKAGIDEKSIEVAGLCTSCRGDLFYSHRRDGAATGRMAGFVEIL